MERSSVLSYLSSLEGRGIRTDLRVVEEVLKAMGSPHQAYPSILIGGTNGKGSIAVLTESILLKARHRVGLYTSPHLTEPRERIRFAGVQISPEDFLIWAERIRRAADHLTYFEFLTVLAFVYFAAKQVDVAVFEVGMGGRFDATNVAKAKISVISNVSLDHEAYLGRTLERIAAEKAGIIKEGGICLTASHQKAVIGVLSAMCRERGATLRRLGGEIRCRRTKDCRFSYHGPDLALGNLRCGLAGGHQIRNAALAVGVVEVLVGEGFSIEEAAVRKGLEEVRWPGRLEVTAEDPLVVLDGAHNPAGMAALCRALRECFSYGRLIVVFGVLADKRAALMMRKIAPLAAQIILTRPPSDRALDPFALVGEARRWCSAVKVVENPREALEEALQVAERGDLICITGSLYLVGLLRRDLVP